MSNRNNWYSWLEAEVPAAGQTPTSDPNLGATGGPPAMPQNTGANQPAAAEAPDDVTQDPEDPDLEPDNPDKDFEQWKRGFFDLSIRGDTNEMMASIERVSNHEGLNSPQRKFVEDNMQILFYRQNDMILPVTKQIRNLIKDDLDRTNPGTTVAQHVTAAMEEHGLLQQNLIKMIGLYGWKGDTHRKFMAALLGAVQVGGGNKYREDLVFADKEYTINISTRFATQWGEINFGAWSLREDDPEKYLTEPEMERLREGSPEEKQVLRRRIHMESIAERFQRRAFLIHVVHTDGTIFTMGYDLGTSILESYKRGKLIIRGQKSESKEAMINDTGEIVPLIDVDVLYVHDTGELDDNGKPQMVELPFMTRRNSCLYLTADIQTLRTAAASMSGMFFREVPYGGNPSDIIKLIKCVPDLTELLGKRCLGNVVPLPKEVSKMDNPQREKPPVAGPPHEKGQL